MVWWFLRDWRATVLSAVALPLSIIPAVGVIYLCGFSLNTITLLSLSAFSRPRTRTRRVSA